MTRVRRVAPHVGQVVGLLAVVVAVGMLAGGWWGLLLAGLVVVAVSALREAGWI